MMFFLSLQMIATMNNMDLETGTGENQHRKGLSGSVKRISMGRPVKRDWIIFRQMLIFEKEEIKFFSVECGASGICALMKLMCNIYRNGYYVEWSKDHEDLFGWDMRGMVPREEIPHIIGVCLKRGIFNSKLF